MEPCITTVVSGLAAAISVGAKIGELATRGCAEPASERDVRVRVAEILAQRDIHVEQTRGIYGLAAAAVIHNNASSGMIEDSGGHGPRRVLRFEFH